MKNDDTETWLIARLAFVAAIAALAIAMAAIFQ